MFERFTERARRVVILAQDEAREREDIYIGCEHILTGLLREEEGLAAKALAHLGVTLEGVRKGADTRVTRGEFPGDTRSPRKLTFTPGAQKVLEAALREALSLGHSYIGTEHVLLGLVRERDNVGVEILRDDFDADPEKIRNEVIRMLSGPKAPILRQKPKPEGVVLRDGSTLRVEEIPDFIHADKVRALMALAVTLGRQHPDHPVEKIVNAAVALDG